MASFARPSYVLDRSVVASIRALGGPGEPDVLVEVSALFLADVPVQLAALRSSADAGDTESLWQLAHQVRGSAAGIGALRMASACSAIELAARCGLPDAARTYLEQLNKEYNLVCAELRHLVGEAH